MKNSQEELGKDVTVNVVKWRSSIKESPEWKIKSVMFSRGQCQKMEGEIKAGNGF
jgi:hypothetical protein